MAIKINSGNIYSSSSLKYKKIGFKYFDRSSNYKYIDNWKFDGEYVIVPSEGNFNIQYIKGKFSHHQKTYRISSTKNYTKYIYYFLLKNINKLYPHGTTVKRINSDQWKKLLKTINVSKFEQKKIIDIIGSLGDEKFAKYSNTIRIDNIENCREDVKAILDIIEPIELVINNLKKQIFLIKELLKLSYKIVNTKHELMINYINLVNQKWNNQKSYCATNAVSEFEIDFSKIINIENERPLRADISPSSESFIFSKLVGDNKIFYFNELPNEVFSTGFYNFTTQYIDFLTGFILSESFVKQKNKFSSGTTMQSLNLKGLSNIKIKKPLNDNKILTETLMKKVNILNKLNNLKTVLIKILIK